MKKVLFFVVVCLLVFTFTVSAQDLEFVSGVSIENWNTNVDVTYKSESDNWFKRSYSSDAALGLYAGGRYWLNEKMAITGGLDMARFSYVYTYENENPYNSKTTNKRTLVGPFGQVSYRLNDIFTLNGGIGYYSYKARETYEDSDENDQNKDYDHDLLKGNGLGFSIGTEIEYPIKENIALNSSLGFRRVNINVDEYYDYYEEEMAKAEDVYENYSLVINSLKIGLGISYEF